MTRPGFERYCLVICLLLGVCAVCAPIAYADGPLYQSPTSRFGVTFNPRFGRITDYDVGALHVSWYSDWGVCRNAPRPGGMEYMQLILVQNGNWSVFSWLDGVWSSDKWTMLRDLISSNPGAVWIIGNEPECPYDPGGGKNTPDQYARVYHELYGYIKLRDPSARVAIGGVVEPTPLRLKWLDQLLGFYQSTYGEPMPVDVWTIHLLILPEKRGDWGCGIPVGLSEDEGRQYGIIDTWNVSIFQELVRDFRTWMRDRGQRDKPLWITEYGVLLPYATTQEVNDFMTGSFDYLLHTSDPDIGYPADANLLVQRWAWNSLNDHPDNFNGALFDHLDRTFPGTPTAFGLNFMAYTSALLTGPACITGTVHLEGRPAVPDASHVTAATVALFRVDDSQSQPDVRNVTTNDAGVFTLCDVPAGTYDIVAKGYNTLASRTNGVVLTAGSNPVDLGTLPCGDANNDNRVTIVDFSILAAAFGTVKGAPTYDDRADFDGNGTVSILDFSLLAAHFGELGAE